MRRGRLLAGVCVIAALTLAGWWWNTRPTPAPTNTTPADDAAPAPAPAPMTASSPAALPPPSRLPDSPLPPPAALEGNAEERAAQLVDRLQRGGEDAVVALRTAVDLAGFPIRHPDGRVTQPSAPSQGIAFSEWEVNALAGLVASRQMVVAPLGSVAAALASVLPGMTDAELTTLLLDGLRRHAHETDGPLVFWSAFIIELGRRAQTHQQYDLLGAVDANAAQLDLVQLAFLTKRLAADVATIAYPDRVTPAATATPDRGLRLLDLIAPAVRAQGAPCQFTDAETEILDWAAIAAGEGFGAVIGHLEDRLVPGAETTAKLVGGFNVLLAYLKVALTQWAFEIRFELQDSPLVRTTKVRPQTGERRTLITNVTLNMGKLSWINCFRIMLNGMGLDLSLDKDGPFKGAEVTWTGWAGFRSPWAIGAGPEHLVQFVGDEGNRIQGSGRTGRAHANMHQVTDANGDARVEIEGRGQDEFLGSQPREVLKEATLSAMVVLKPNDLFGDFKEAALTARGGLAGALALPAELLFRTRWNFGATHTIAVKDWKVGNGWTGTVSYRVIEQRFSENVNESHCCGGRPARSESRTESQLTKEAHWELPADTGTDALTADFSMGTARMTITAERSERGRRHGNSYASCRGGSHPMTTTTSEREQNGHAEYAGTAQVTVQLDDNGEFRISAGLPDEEAIGEITTVTTMKRNDGCTGDLPPRVDKGTSTWRAGGVSASIRGKADPDTDTLQGTMTKVTKSRDGRLIRTQIYEWNLRR
jgi:hypothetical protein